jgi:hypothetical protein
VFNALSEIGKRHFMMCWRFRFRRQEMKRLRKHRNSKRKPSYLVELQQECTTEKIEQILQNFSFLVEIGDAKIYTEYCPDCTKLLLI